VSYVEEDEVIKTLGILEFGWSNNLFLKKSILFAPSFIYLYKLVVGLSLGPLIGSALYYIYGYSLPFWFFGFTIIVCLPYINKLHINEGGLLEDETGFVAYMLDFVIK